MTQLILSQSNLKFFKRTLRPACPDIKSAHLSEALASAFGFRTHISLIARLKETGGRRPDLVNVDHRLFCTRLSDFGFAHSGYDDLEKVVRSASLPEPIWCVQKGFGIQTLEAWYKECQRRNIPYVYITNRRKYAQVDWDHISLAPKHDDALKKMNFDPLYRSFQELAFGSIDAKFYGSGLVGSVENILIEDAPALADAIFSHMYKAVSESTFDAV